MATFATLATSIAAIGALYMTSETLDANRQQTALSEQGQYTDRFGRAIEQLGSDKIDIRLGGIFALERLAKDSPRDASTIARLLAAYVREVAPCPAKEPEPVPQRNGTAVALPRLPADVDAVLSVLSARDYRVTSSWVDVTNTCFTGRNLGHEQLGNLDLRSAQLADSFMGGAQLRGLRLDYAILSKASLGQSAWCGIFAHSADLRQAELAGAMFYNVDFAGSTLENADLGRVHVTRMPGQECGAPYADPTVAPTSRPAVSFRFASLSGAIFLEANLPHADFSYALLDGADFSGSHLSGAAFNDFPGSPHPQRVNFDDADLSNADFSGRDMRAMSLTRTNLSGANLSDTDLRGVDLRSTNLSGAKLDRAKR